MSRTLLILGGDGYIGKSVVQKFISNNWSVMKLNSRIPNFLELEQEIIDASKASNSSFTLLNTAWSPKPSTRNRQDLEHLNWVGFTNRLIQLSAKFDIPFYGLGSGLEKANLKDAYCQAKQECCELIERSVSRKNNVNVGWLRPHYVYSLNPPSPTLVSDVAKQLVKNNSAVILTNNSHDFVSLDDCVTQIFLAVSNKVTGIVDIGSGTLMSNANLVKKLFPGREITSEVQKEKTKGVHQFTGTADIRWINKIQKS